MKVKPYGAVAALATTLLLTACQTSPESSVDPGHHAASPTPVAPSHGSPSAEVLAPDRARVTARQQVLEVGDGSYLGIAEGDSREPDATDEGDVTLNFQDADLREFLRAVLGEILQKNYLLDPDVNGRVTIETARPIRRQDVQALVEQVLAANNAAMIETNGMYRITTAVNAERAGTAPRVIDRRAAAGYATRIIPLRFIAASEMQKIIEPLLEESASMRVDTKRNLLIASAQGAQLDVIQDTVDIFDVDWMRGMSVGLFPLEHVDPKTLKDELDTIIGAMDGGDETGLMGNVVRTVAIERLGSILIISATAHGLREVELWLHRLDKPGEHAGKRLYVYDVQNAKATDLSEVLGHIFGATARTVRSTPSADLAPGLTPVEISSGDPVLSEAERDTSRSPGPADGALPSRESIEIIADDVRNALVVLATPGDYRMIESAIKRLDVVPLQVLIEASIIEVTLQDDLNYGVEWFFKNALDNGSKEGRGTLDLGNAGIAALAPSFSYTIVDNFDQVRLALNALEQESEVNILSSPTLMVLDNQTAIINVGDEIPVPTRQSVSVIDPDAPTVNEIQFRQTGVTLTVTPRVNNSGLVTMDIRQEVSNAISTTTSDIDAPTIRQRQVESVVAINSGETIVLGGLIQDTRSVAESGIPVLHRIPIIGKLFGQTRDEGRRTELLVLITPRVVRNRNDALDITDEFRKKLQGLAPG